MGVPSILRGHDQAGLTGQSCMVPVERVGPFLWRVPPDARPGMRVPGLVVADEALMAGIRTDAALEQLATISTRVARLRPVGVVKG